VDGPPQLTPVWYIYKDGRLYIGIVVGSAKHRNLQRDPRVSVCIDGGHGDARAVMIYGTAELIYDDNPLRKEKSWQLIRKYHDSEEEARRYEAAIDWESLLIVVNPEKIISQDFNQ
jgi:PPOX class probable F420-dependent enzyme